MLITRGAPSNQQEESLQEEHGDHFLFSLRIMHRYGLTDRVEIFGAFDFVPASFSAQLGAKLSLYGTSNSLNALALRPRVAQVVGGFSLESMYMTEVDVALPNTIRLSKSFDLTLSPTFGLGWFTRTDPYGVPQDTPDMNQAVMREMSMMEDQGYETMRARAWQWGGSIILTHYQQGNHVQRNDMEGGRVSDRALYYELTMTQNSSFEQTDRDGYQITFGIGIPFDPFAN